MTDEQGRTLRHRFELQTLPVASLLFTAALISAACGSSPTVITADAQPIVDRILAADPIERWAFLYQPDTASPYLACLGGVDEVQGVIDVGNKVLSLEPNRDAPPVTVTDASVLVPDPREPETWHEISRTPTLDPAQLQPIFGEVLAGYIATGLRAPDLNMITQAAIDIATSVEATDPRSSSPATQSASASNRPSICKNSKPTTPTSAKTKATRSPLSPSSSTRSAESLPSSSTPIRANPTKSKQITATATS